MTPGPDSFKHCNVSLGRLPLHISGHDGHLQGLLKEQLELVKTKTADGKSRYTIAPLSSELSFDKGASSTVWAKSKGHTIELKATVDTSRSPAALCLLLSQAL